MSKRNSIVIKSKESEALKTLRVKNNLSLRKLAGLMDISFSRAHQMESGKENISEEYIRKFLVAIKMPWNEWNNHLGNKDSYSELRDKCHELLDSIEPSKLDLIFRLLSSM